MGIAEREDEQDSDIMDIDPGNYIQSTLRESDHGGGTGSGHEIAPRRLTEKVKELIDRREEEVEEEIMDDAEQSTEQEKDVEEGSQSNARRLLGHQQLFDQENDSEGWRKCHHENLQRESDLLPSMSR